MNPLGFPYTAPFASHHQSRNFVGYTKDHLMDLLGELSRSVNSYAEELPN